MTFLMVAFFFFVVLNHLILVMKLVDIIVLVNSWLSEILSLSVWILLVVLPGLGLQFGVDVLCISLDKEFLLFFSLNFEFDLVGFLLQIICISLLRF
jgi:hypothetical protein